ncbi:hypothetical protein GCM10022419_133300 [Nonomuraea rosea]|uniref:Secreted protein n=1 Tax=Nonomuraea rosea TaxID=638574 RepID=A0ABP7A577_9ACTN
MSRLIRGCVSAFLLALSLTACDGNATTGTPAPSPSASGTQDALLRYVQCMRDNGVQMKDPNPEDAGAVSEGIDTSSAVYKAAEQACAGERKGIVQNRKEEGDDDPKQETDELLALAACLREHGVEVSDPVPGQDGGQLKGLDRTDPRARNAIQECQKSQPAPSERG